MAGPPPLPKITPPAWATAPKPAAVPPPLPAAARPKGVPPPLPAAARTPAVPPPLPKGPALGVGGPDMPGTRANPLTRAQADALFKELSDPNNKIPFNWPRDGCYARAHEMRRLMEAKGVESEKIFIYGKLEVKSEALDGETINWGYHVAPTIQVQGADGKPTPMVIDPSLSKELLTPQQWKDKQNDPAARLEAAPGHVVYKDEGKPLSAGFARDDTYEGTKVWLEGFRRERANWDATHPKK